MINNVEIVSLAMPHTPDIVTSLVLIRDVRKLWKMQDGLKKTIFNSKIHYKFTLEVKIFPIEFISGCWYSITITHWTISS